jgi:TRAP-type C4-dicarboxylate transport system substrate-binding protein
MTRMFRLALVAAGVAAAVPTLGAQPAPTLIKMGTVAPQGSPWHDVLQQMGQDWQRLSGGRIRLHIYAGGTLGEESDMVTKMRIGQLQAVAISGAGMPHIEPGISCLQIPMMFDSYEELDHVRGRIAPLLEKRILEKGFVVLNWGDAGWVHFFTKKPASRPDDLRKMKLFITAGDAEMLDLYKAAGMQPVPLALTDILPALQTGMIDAFDVPPLAALVNQWFGPAPHMLDLKWAPLIGATVIRKSAWDRIPADLRPGLLETARAAGEKFREDIRRLNDEAVREMEKRGLTVVRPDPATVELWRKEAEAVYPKLRGSVIPADLFDEVRRLRDEVRARESGGS